MKRTISKIVLYSTIGAAVLPLGKVEATNNNNIPTNLNTSSDVSGQLSTQAVSGETEGISVIDQNANNEARSSSGVDGEGPVTDLMQHVLHSEAATDQIVINGEEEESPVIDLTQYVLQAENCANQTIINEEEEEAPITDLMQHVLHPEATINQIVINGEGEGAPVIDLTQYVLQAETSDRSITVEEESDLEQASVGVLEQPRSITSVAELSVIENAVSEEEATHEEEVISEEVTYEEEVVSEEATHEEEVISEEATHEEEIVSEEATHREEVISEEELIEEESAAEQISEQVQSNDVSAIQSEEGEFCPPSGEWIIGEPVFYNNDEDSISEGGIGEPVFYNNGEEVAAYSGDEAIEEETVNEPAVQSGNEGDSRAEPLSVSPIIINYEGEPVRERAVTLDDIDLSSVQERAAAIDDKTTPIFRGNVSAVEVAMGSNPSILPDVEAIQTGKIAATTRIFDLICTGRCDFSTTKDKLDVVSESKIPTVLNINTSGNIVFINPSRMCTMQTPPGINNWVNVVVESIKSKSSDAAKHMCLGIRRKGKSDYIDTLYTGHLTSTDFTMEDGDVIELVPRVSRTDVASSRTYVASGTLVSTTSPAIPTTTPFDFGTVFRAKISAKGHWVKKTCNLSAIVSGGWYSHGSVGVGPVTDVNGVSRGERMLAINHNGTLAYSADGATWTKTGLVGTAAETSWNTGLVYGNGIWCAISYNTSYGVRRSLNGGKDWSKTLSSTNSDNLGFGNDVFMTVNAGKVYTSPDAELWTQIGEIGNATVGYTLLYGNDQWVFVNSGRKVYGSKDGKGTWTSLDSSTTTTKNLINVLSYCIGGCYANGYFYVIDSYGSVASSKDGSSWTKIWDNGTAYGNFRNITYFQNRFYVFSYDGTDYEIGIPRPDGTI